MSTHRLDPLSRYTDAGYSRPLPAGLLTARRDVAAVVNRLQTIPDAALARSWAWKGGSEEEVRYGFYRIAEAFERAGILARAALDDCVEPGRAADLIAPATAARWDLDGLLAGVPDALWDAEPGDGEWTIRATMGHVIGTQRAYGWGTAWWQGRAYRIDDADLPPHIPDELMGELPAADVEVEGTPAQVRERLREVLDAAAERLAGLPAERLTRGARWSGFAVDIAFRLGRWSSHIREHTVQVEKTLDRLGYRPTEVDRLVRLVMAAWGRAEQVVYGTSGACESVRQLEEATPEAQRVAAEISTLARSL